MEQARKMRNFGEKILRYVYGIPALIVSAILAGFICMAAAICYFRGLIPDAQLLQKSFFPSFVMVFYALPGLAIFLLWSENMDRNGRLAMKHYSLICLTIDAPLCATLVAMSCITFMIATGNIKVILYSEQLLAIFATMGFLTAIFHWRIALFLKSLTVTLLKESAKKELYSQF